MNLELKARITEVNLGVIDINGFKFNLHKMEVENLKDFKVLLPIFNDVSIGDCFVTKNWALTRITTSDGVSDNCVRVSDFELVSSEGFEVSPYLNTKVVGMFINSDKCYLRTIGVEKRPFYMATLKIKDETEKLFELPLVAFGNQAKKLSAVKKHSIIECEVTVKRRRDLNGYELAVIKLNVKSEVN